jgi:hypothetical protein
MNAEYCTDCRAPLDSPNELESGLCLRCLNGPLPRDSRPTSADTPCPHGWRDARCGRFGERGPCGCTPDRIAARRRGA